METRFLKLSILMCVLPLLGCNNNHEPETLSFYINYHGSEVETLNLEVNSQLKLKSSLSDPFKDQSAIWSSNNNSIVSVDNGGVLVANSIGDATITATSRYDRNLSTTFTVYVTNEDSDVKYYLGGYGKFCDGAYYSYHPNYALKLVSTDVYTIYNAYFAIGDNFSLYLKETEEYKSFVVDTNTGSFTSKNMKVNNLDDSRVSIDCLKTGYYNVTYSKGVVSVTNGKNTSDNLSRNAPSGDINLDIFSFSDYHGNVETDDYYPSISKYVSYAKSEMDKVNNDKIVINNGDLWQGGYYSNVTKGKLLNEAISLLNTDAFVLGNHEFDWSPTYITDNQKTSNFPYLGANIVDRYNESKLASYVAPYTIIEKSGLNIGIIGLIKHSGITSITSSNVENISFLNDLETAKKYSDVLRKDFNCDIVIVSDHTGTETGYVNILSNLSPNTGKRYADAIIFGHDHITAMSNDPIPYINSGKNGSNLSNIGLTYSNGTVSCRYTKNLRNSSTNYTYIYEYEDDTDVNNILDKWITPSIKEKANSVCCSLSGDVSNKSVAPNITARAMYEYVTNEGYDIDLAMVNTTRNSYNVGDVTFSDIFAAVPFTNQPVIVDVKGKDLLNEASYAYYYAPTPFGVHEYGTYKIAVYDYLIYHQNEKRVPDYFQFSYPLNVYGTLESYPADFTYSYLCSLNEKPVNVSMFLGNNYSFIA